MEALSWLLLAVAVGLFWYQFGSDLLGLIDRHPVETPLQDGEVEEFQWRTVMVIAYDDHPTRTGDDPYVVVRDD